MLRHPLQPASIGGSCRSSSTRDLALVALSGKCSGMFTIKCVSSCKSSLSLGLRILLVSCQWFFSAPGIVANRLVQSGASPSCDIWDQLPGWHLLYSGESAVAPGRPMWLSDGWSRRCQGVWRPGSLGLKFTTNDSIFWAVVWETIYMSHECSVYGEQRLGAYSTDGVWQVVGGG
jgi:hypothetical protein